jgi:hypothetical protein
MRSGGMARSVCGFTQVRARSRTLPARQTPHPVRPTKQFVVALDPKSPRDVAVSSNFNQR